MAPSPTTTGAGSASRFYLAAAVLLGLAYFSAVLLGTGGATGPAFRATAFAGVPGVLYAFLLLRIGRRARWFEGGRRRLAWLHAALGLGYTAAWSGTVVVLFAIERAATT